MDSRIEGVPILVVRNIIIFPYMLIPLNIGRSFSIKAVEESLTKNNNQIAVFTQKKTELEDVVRDEIYDVGVYGNIIKMVRFPDGNVRILLEAVDRISLDEFRIENGASSGDVTRLDEIDHSYEKEQAALYKIVKKKFEQALVKGLTITPEIISPEVDVEQPARLSDIIVAQLDIELYEKYNVLKELDVERRLEFVNDYLSKEFDILDMRNKIQEKMKEGIDESQKEYLLREQLRVIQEELGMRGESEDEADRYIDLLSEKRFPNYVLEKAMKEVERLRKIPLDSSEAGVVRNYLDFIVELPWKVYSREKRDLKKSEQILNETHYGLEDVKDRILEYLSVRKISKKLKTPILCLIGPPGVGKTSIGKAVAKSLNREFVRISLGGVRDEAEIRGHRRTYVGALPGRILSSIKNCRKSNPIFMLDEIDKLGSDFRGDPASAMLEVLDPEQNVSFVDHFLELEYDLSKVFFITTANYIDDIPEPLLDRMELISLPGYTLNEKAIIAKEYLIARQLEQNGLDKKGIKFDNKSIEKIILNYTREAGVRNLEREIGKVCRKIARKIVLKEEYPKNIDENDILNILGVEKFEMSDITNEHDIGVATGLAWTQFGGDVLNIEVELVKGSGNLILTGQLGETMQESAQTAMTHIRTLVNSYKGNKKYYSEYNIHIHVPEGAVPKDGPSAGITIASAIYSKLKEKPILKSVAMTGEITLTGKVLAIGGLKEKLLASKLRGITKVLVPKTNKKDLKEISEEIKSGIELVFVEYYRDVIKELFGE